MAIIFKIMSRKLWTEAQARGELEGAPVDLKDGFIHFSTAEQVRETAARHFRGQSDLVIAAVDGDALGVPLTWEPSRGGALFPHLYARMPVSAVRWAKDLTSDADGNHVFPPLE